MLGRRINRFALAAILAITSIAMTANAQSKTVSDSTQTTQTMNLSNAQVFRIQGLLGSQTRELQALNAQVQSMHEFLQSALADNDPARIGMAVLALDAAEKALENTKQANRRDLLSLLNENQKHILKNNLSKSAASSD
jgi:hypothetical protein